MDPLGNNWRHEALDHPKVRRSVKMGPVAWGATRTQSLQNPLIKEYTLNYIRDPNMI